MAGHALSLDEVRLFIAREFAHDNSLGHIHEVEAVGPMTARVRLPFRPHNIRPGGTLSGPAMMGLADYALYIAVIANAGPLPLAVTTSLSFNFLRRPQPRDLVAECRLLKLGKRLAIGEVSLHSDGSEDLVCHATGTYSLPARESLHHAVK